VRAERLDENVRHADAPFWAASRALASVVLRCAFCISYRHLGVTRNPSGGWPGENARESQSPVLVFYTPDVQFAYERLVAHGLKATPPFDHGFATLTAFEGPDGNNVQLMTPASSRP